MFFPLVTNLTRLHESDHRFSPYRGSPEGRHESRIVFGMLELNRDNLSRPGFVIGIIRELTSVD